MESVRCPHCPGFQQLLLSLISNYHILRFVCPQSVASILAIWIITKVLKRVEIDWSSLLPKIWDIFPFVDMSCVKSFMSSHQLSLWPGSLNSHDAKTCLLQSKIVYIGKRYSFEAKWREFGFQHWLYEFVTLGKLFNLSVPQFPSWLN